MKDFLRTLVAAAVGAAVALVVMVGQPALAQQLDRARGHKVTSAQIKDGTIRLKDLGPEVSGPLAEAGTALQSIPDGAVTGPKLADGSVSGSKLTATSVTGSKVVDGSLTGADVANRSLSMSDVAVDSGVLTTDFFPMQPSQCGQSNPVAVGFDPTDDFIVVAQPPFAGNIVFAARPSATPNAIDIIWCNNGNAAYDPPSYGYHWAIISN